MLPCVKSQVLQKDNMYAHVITGTSRAHHLSCIISHVFVQQIVAVRNAPAKKIVTKGEAQTPTQGVTQVSYHRKLSQTNDSDSSKQSGKGSRRASQNRHRSENLRSAWTSKKVIRPLCVATHNGPHLLTQRDEYEASSRPYTFRCLFPRSAKPTEGIARLVMRGRLLCTHLSPFQRTIAYSAALTATT